MDGPIAQERPIQLLTAAIPGEEENKIKIVFWMTLSHTYTAHAPQLVCLRVLKELVHHQLVLMKMATATQLGNPFQLLMAAIIGELTYMYILQIYAV